ncbi:MAG: ATP-binding cassette domain-containing protein, partial [Microvirga sp.]
MSNGVASLSTQSASSEAASAVSVNNLRKSFGNLEVLKGVSLSAKEGDVISILGASGSGKSTMLRCINMLEVPDSGDIRIGGETIGLKKGRKGMEPADQHQVDRIRSRVAMVFQSFNLWSHMTILENVIEAPVHVQKRPKAECIAEAEEL